MGHLNERRKNYPLGPHRSPDNLTEEQFQKWLSAATPDELEEYGKLKEKYVIPFTRMIHLGFSHPMGFIPSPPPRNP